MRFSEYLQLCEEVDPPAHLVLEDGFYLEHTMTTITNRAVVFSIGVLMHDEPIGEVEARQTREDGGTGMWIYSMADRSMSGSTGVPNQDVFNWHELGEWVMKNLREDGVVEKYT